MIEAPLTTQQRLSRGEVRCLACSRWFRPSGMCATRCHNCMSAFFKRALSQQFINPVVKPAWPGMIDEKNETYVPHA